MLTQTAIVEAANKFFPNNWGVLITGSQQANSTLKKENDIDIIILDTLVSNQLGVFAEKDGYKIDFIIMPVLDIENIMDNSLHEPKNGLLHLMQATVLSDPHNIINPILDKAKELFNRVQYRTQLEYERLMIELVKLNKLFATNLSHVEKVILLSDFVSIISVLETIRVTNWSSKTKHKLRNLNEKSPQFLNKILTLYNQGIKHEYYEIITFINFYHKNYLLSQLPVNKKYSTLVVEIRYQDFAITQFVKDVLPQIINKKDIAGKYLFFYLSPNKYKNKFKHNVSIVFEINNEESCLQLLEDINNTKDKITKVNVYLEHFCEGEKYPLLDDYLIQLKIKVSAFSKASIEQNNDFIADEMINFFFKFCFYTKNVLCISNENFQKINSVIAQKWIFTKVEQEQAENYPALVNLRNVIMNRASNFYNYNMPALLQMVLIDTKDNLPEDNLIKQIYSIIDSIYKNIDDFVINESDIYYTIISALKFPNAKIIMLYKLIVEQVLLVLNLTDTDKVNALYSCSKAMGELGKDTEPTIFQPTHP